MRYNSYYITLDIILPCRVGAHVAQWALSRTLSELNVRVLSMSSILFITPAYRRFKKADAATSTPVTHRQSLYRTDMGSIRYPIEVRSTRGASESGSYPGVLILMRFELLFRGKSCGGRRCRMDRRRLGALTT